MALLIPAAFSLLLNRNVFADSSLISVPLQRTGTDPDATGLVTVNLAFNASSLTVLTTNLAPARSYSVLVGGLYRGSFVTAANGRGQIKFARPAVSGAFALNFDPRGSEVIIWRKGAAILRSVVSGPGEPRRSSVNEQLDLPRLAGGGTATVKYRLLPDGTRRFSTALTNVADGEWLLYVDGIYRGKIDVRGGGGRRGFDNNSGTPDDSLNFEPREKRVEITRFGNLRFSGLCEAKANGINVAAPSVQTRFIPSTGVDSDGFAQARYRVDRDARRKFDVELENVPVGAYELVVDGVLRGVIQVITTADGTEGEIEFSSVPDDEEELSLNFQPLTATYEVRIGSTVYFQGTLASALPYTGGNQGPLSLRESLTSTGLDSDAHGEAEYRIDDQNRHRFKVEIEDVPVGSYALWVGAAMRGTIVVQAFDATTQGELEFSRDTEPGHLPLTFEPRGKLIEVKGAAGTFFSHFFGVGATNGAVAVPIEVELPLFSFGIDEDGSAEVEFKRDDDGDRHFDVELENVPAGEYALLVDGAWLANIAVVATTDGVTRGKIEFEDKPEEGEVLLTFDPTGKTIAIERDGVRYFERTLPITP